MVIWIGQIACHSVFQYVGSVLRTGNRSRFSGVFLAIHEKKELGSVQMFTCLFLVFVAFIVGIILLACAICFVFTRVLFIRKLQTRLLTSIENTEIQSNHLSSIHYSEIFFRPEKLSPKTGKCIPFLEV